MVRVTMLIAKNIPDKVCNNQRSWLLGAGYILWCDLHLCESILSFFLYKVHVRSYATTGENLLVERDLTTRLCIKSVPLFSWRARHNCWVTRER